MSDAPTSFADLQLDPRILQAVTAVGYDVPTPIQLKAIPVLLAGRDVLGGARTGSGKTAAFGLPLIERLKDGGKRPRALVLVPTRELAQQVTEALSSYSAQLPAVEVFAVYGGAPYQPQIDAMRRGATIVVGTPGRLLDHLERGTLDLSAIETVVLDEADEMLRMGFIDAVETLLDATPDGRQLALFSASLPERIEDMAKAYLVDPVEVQVESSAMSVEHISQSWMLVPFRHKIDALIRLMRSESAEAVLVFVRTRKACAEVADELASRGMPVDALHGDLAQPARDRVLDRLRAGQLTVLIATDVAARGIDVAQITHVINFDLPDDVEAYVHRIGRTGRAGRQGRAISFVTAQEQRRMRAFQKALGVPMPREQVASDAQIAERGRRALWDDLLARHAEGGLEDHAAWLEEALKGTDLDLHAIAATAIAMIADERGTVFDEASDELPDWAQPPAREREDRGERGDRPDQAQFVDLFLPIGGRRGVRTGDVVGALTHGVGMPAEFIGRITVLDFKTFVGIRIDAVDRLLERVDTLTLRGVDVPLSRARPRGDGPMPPQKRPPFKRR